MADGARQMPRTEGQYNRGPNLATPWLAVARVALTPFGKVLLCPFRALGPNHGVRIGCWTARERTGSRTGITLAQQGDHQHGEG